MLHKIMFVVLAVLLLTAPVFAEGDTSSTFMMAVGSVLAAQNQETEDVTSRFQFDVIKLIPWTPWYMGGMLQYSRLQTPGEDEVEYNGRLIAFSKDPNSAELHGDWVAFATVGSWEIHDNDDQEDKQVARGSPDGSIGVIGPIAGINVVMELGAKRMPNLVGKMETYWSFGIGFFGVPKL
jgi:hypothetical protein